MSQFAFGDKIIEAKTDTDVEIIELLQPVSVEALKPINLDPGQETALTELSHQIDVSDSDAIMNYGDTAQMALAEFAKKSVQGMKASDAGEVGKLVSELTVQLETGASEEESKNVIAKFFKKNVNKLKAMQIQYESAQSNIDRIVGTVENHLMILTSDNKGLEEMKKANYEQFKVLKVYIEAGRQKIAELNETELVRLTELSKSGDPGDINQLTTLSNQISQFENKLADLDASMMISQILAAQLETMTNGNRALIQKLKSVKTTTVPIWQANMSAMLYSEDTRKAVESQKQITDVTQAMLIEGAKRFRETSNMVQTEAERQVVSIETIKVVNNELIESLKDIQRIKDAGTANRKQAQIELETMREELGTQLIETSRIGQ